MKAKFTALLLAAVSAVSLAACNKPITQAPATPSTAATTAQATEATDAPTEAPTEAPTQAPVIRAPEDYVVTQDEYASLYSGTFTITGEDAYQEQHEVTNRLPQLTIDSEDAQAINAQISEDCTVFENGRQIADSGVADRTDYAAYVNGSVLSLIIETRSINTPNSFFYVYNIDVLTGKSVSSDELFTLANTSYEEVNAQIVAAIDETFSNAESVAPDSSIFERAKEQTLSDDNLASAAYYFDGDGNLCAAYRYFWVAGASNYGAVCKTGFYIQ